MPDIYELSIKICNEAGHENIDWLRRRLIVDHGIILGHRECLELLEDIKQLRKGVENANWTNHPGRDTRKERGVWEGKKRARKCAA